MDIKRDMISFCTQYNAKNNDLARYGVILVIPLLLTRGLSRGEDCESNRVSINGGVSATNGEQRLWPNSEKRVTA